MNDDNDQNVDYLNLSNPYQIDRDHFLNNVSSELKTNILKFDFVNPKAHFL